MQFLDGFVDASFIRDEDGRLLFYPWGMFASGYEMSGEGEAQVRKFLKLFYGVSFGVILCGLLLFGMWTFLSLGFLIPWYATSIHMVLRHRKRSDRRIDLDETARDIGRTIGMAGTVFMLVASIALFLISAALVVFVEDNGQVRFGGFFGMAVFGLAVVLYARQWMIMRRDRNNKD
ncbi:hypothetical protein [Pseudodesulfovibrio tunisiensis]|uniref:hypothetical protein n=1 Tax=Pseudodesulfovibrio tunisiensis TaxID=463192 RepID=UPI001FB20315|nr:hypothetical protein [Pseudodesulfovibrio tunisiensis]